MRNQIISATKSASTNVTNSISTNVTSTVPINSGVTKVTNTMGYHILHMFLLVTILLFTIAIICYHYAKHSSKKKILAL